MSQTISQGSQYHKEFVPVLAVFTREGKLIPLKIRLRDLEYKIDRVLDERSAASTKVGGHGIRYTIRILGHETYLFYEPGDGKIPGRWFVEERINS